MLELFETESRTVLATYDTLDEARRDICEEVHAGGRAVARTWALSERKGDGGVVCLAIGDALADWAVMEPVSVAP